MQTSVFFEDDVRLHAVCRVVHAMEKRVAQRDDSFYRSTGAADRQRWKRRWNL